MSLDGSSVLAGAERLVRLFGRYWAWEAGRGVRSWGSNLNGLIDRPSEFGAENRWVSRLIGRAAIL